jgi:hypothetical protein
MNDRIATSVLTTLDDEAGPRPDTADASRSLSDVARRLARPVAASFDVFVIATDPPKSAVGAVAANEELLGDIDYHLARFPLSPLILWRNAIATLLDELRAAATDEKVARAVAKRSRKQSTLFNLATGEVELGGQHKIPVQFPEREDILLRGCRVVRWPGEFQCEVQSAELDANPRLASLARDGKLKARVGRDSEEYFVACCAHTAQVLVDLSLNLVEELHPARVTPWLMAVHGGEKAELALQAKLDSRRHG